MTTLSDVSVSELITFLKEKPRATRHGNREYIDTGNNLELIRLPRHAVTDADSFRSYVEREVLAVEDGEMVRT